MTKRVIVADDDKDTRYAIVTSIESVLDGVEIDEVSSGEELVEKVLQGLYDFGFTDNKMHVMTGAEAIRAIREAGIKTVQNPNKDIPLVMISGDRQRAEAMKAGATDYIEKGKVYAEIERVLLEHLG